MVKIRNYNVWGYSRYLKRSTIYSSFWKKKDALKDAQHLRNLGVTHVVVEKVVR